MRLKILYIVYWGALEQLGQSLVIPAVKKLSQLGAEITLVTFEKPHDLQNITEMERVRQLLDEDKIEWIPLQYHKTPRMPATLFDISHGIARALQKRLRKRYDIVHGRTFIGGLIGITVAALTGAKFVYHNEGFYPDEMVDGGFWAENSRPHRVAKYLENRMYSRAAGIIALSYRAKAVIEALPEVLPKKTPVIVVPSCVDLQTFHLPEKRPDFLRDEVKLVYIGSVGGRYILDKIGAFIAAIRKVNPKVTLKIFSKADPELIDNMLSRGGLAKDAWSLEAVAYADMPQRLSQYQAGLFFLTQGISEHGCSPTKIGEYWAVGLPVITSPNVSDTDEIINREKVGVIVNQHTEESYLQAFQELATLLAEDDLYERCRRAAENHYALTPACQRQFKMYRIIMDN